MWTFCKVPEYMFSLSARAAARATVLCTRAAYDTVLAVCVWVARVLKNEGGGGENK